jgi:hypothetical protein
VPVLLLGYVVRLEHTATTLPLLVLLSLDAPRTLTSMCMMLTMPVWKSAAGAYFLVGALRRSRPGSCCAHNVGKSQNRNDERGEHGRWL